MRETDRLKSGIWVSAQVRLCGRLGLAVYVVRKGDADAGAILLKLRRAGGLWAVLSQARLADGSLGWSWGTGPEPVPEADADSYLERQVKYDPDIWIVEIEDPESRYAPDGPIV